MPLSIEMVVVTRKNTSNKNAISAMEDEFISCMGLLCFLIIPFWGKF
jgi:hypothetical protein